MNDNFFKSQSGGIFIDESEVIKALIHVSLQSRKPVCKRVYRELMKYGPVLDEGIGSNGEIFYSIRQDTFGHVLTILTDYDFLNVSDEQESAV